MKSVEEDELQISRLTEKDISEVKRIESESNLSAWSRESYREVLNNPTYICLGTRINKKTIGFLVARLIISINAAEVCNVAISNLYRDKNLGSRLMREFLEFCRDKNLRRIFLEVRESNERATAFYKKNGFVVVGKRKKFYAHPSEDALLMEREA